jgi:hypothetical protein
MAKKKEFYDKQVLVGLIKFINELPEKQRRYYIAMEYKRLGRGSQRYLAETFGCARQIIVNGVKEIEAPDFNPDYTRQRSKGGGRKKRSHHY